MMQKRRLGQLCAQLEVQPCAATTVGSSSQTPELLDGGAGPLVQDMFGPLSKCIRQAPAPDLLPIRVDPGTAPFRPGGLLDGATAQLQQRTHEYYRDETGCVSFGLWELKGAVREARVPSAERDLFLMLLPGSTGAVTLTSLQTGEKITADGPSQALAIPRGAEVLWDQPEEAQLVMAYETFTGTAPGAAANQQTKKEKETDEKSKRPLVAKKMTGDVEAPRIQMEKFDTSRYIGEVPTQHLKPFYADQTGQLVSALWDTTTMHTKPLPHPGNPPVPHGQIEYTYLVKGECTIRNGDGIDSHFKTGESYLVPRGMIYSWHSEGYTQKIACNFKPKPPPKN